MPRAQREHALADRFPCTPPLAAGARRRRAVRDRQGLSSCTSMRSAFFQAAHGGRGAAGAGCLRDRRRRHASDSSGGDGTSPARYTAAVACGLRRSPAGPWPRIRSSCTDSRSARQQPDTTRWSSSSSRSSAGAPAALPLASAPLSADTWAVSSVTASRARANPPAVSSVGELAGRAASNARAFAVAFLVAGIGFLTIANGFVGSRDRQSPASSGSSSPAIGLRLPTDVVDIHRPKLCPSFAASPHLGPLGRRKQWHRHLTREAGRGAANARRAYPGVPRASGRGPAPSGDLLSPRVPPPLPRAGARRAASGRLLERAGEPLEGLSRASS